MTAWKVQIRLLNTLKDCHDQDLASLIWNKPIRARCVQPSAGDRDTHRCRKLTCKRPSTERLLIIHGLGPEPGGNFRPYLGVRLTPYQDSEVL